MELPNPYEWKHYKLLILIPLLLIVASAGLIFFKGVKPGIELKGGLLITVETEDSVDLGLVKERLSRFSRDVSVREFNSAAGKGIEIELELNEDLEKAQEGMKELRDLNSELLRAEFDASYYRERNESNSSELAASALAKARELNERLRGKAVEVLGLLGRSQPLPEEARDVLELVEKELDLARSSYRDGVLAEVGRVVSIKSFSSKEVGSSLSKFFFSQVQQIIVVAFILSAIVIFIVVRGFVASGAVIFGAAADIFITLGAMSLFEIPLSLASFSALLMLIGFSLETDCMLSIRVLKRSEDNPRTRAYEAMKTGILMNSACMTGFGVLSLAGVVLEIPVYYQLGVVVVIGCFFDLIATWCANAVMILHYVEWKNRKKVV